MFAAIDIGTNSVRLLIAERNNDKIIPIHRDLRSTRLGEGLESTGRISKEAIARTLDALVAFMETIQGFNVKQVKAVATSAMREASNAGELLELAWQEARLEIDIISGEEEAELSYSGACSELDMLEDGIVVDIGGGSTEIVFKQDNEIIFTSSPVGAVRCTENSTTPTQIYAELEEHLDKIKNLRHHKLIAVGGTATNLAAITKKLTNYDPDLVHGSEISIEELGKTIFYIGSKSLAQRLAIPGLQPERADIIIAGLLILWVIMTYLNINKVIVSEADILYGIILKYA
ncbi:Ppx/GppA phosphatase family protein [Desulfitibacter alkalitolerans]|uniref:Ppx/GppA phosphatase family protein n=1 Tax=Desulfitibacter alkalitolerans TaxID=264641 RepID=UPI0004893436|nr:Ppx/GppA phosphatase family protein [Desulfitibacter alkalitolerans]